MAQTCTITTIYQYPVKSCRGVSVESAAISPTGIVGDRQLMILKDGKFVNQARVPLLARVATRRIDDSTIGFAASDADQLTHSIAQDGEILTVDFYGNPVGVVDQGDALSDWISSVAENDLRVVSLEKTFKRAIPLEEFAVVDGADQSRFVDVAPILVTNEASLEDLNGRLDQAVPMNRFRPNVVVEGLDAFAEDDVQKLAIGSAEFIRATHCERCAVTCTDQETGERKAEPLKTLRGYRHRENGYAGGVMFGSYMGVVREATIRVGDVLTVS